MSNMEIRDWAIAVAQGVCVGVPFGYIMHKSGVANAKIIQGQFEVKSNTMLRTFFSAATASGFSITLGHALGVLDVVARPLNLVRNLVGGLLLGAGMYESGSCPGSVYVQMGNGNHESAVYVFAGGVVGAAIEAYTAPMFLKMFGPEGGRPLRLDTMIGVSFPTLAIPFFSAIAAGLYYEYTLQCKAAGKSTTVSTVPYVYGGLLGSMQIPSVLIAGERLGTSSSFAIVACRMVNLVAVVPGKICRFAVASMYNVFMMSQCVFMSVGAYLASGEERKRPAAPFSKVRAFGGGVMMVFGSRMAGGCTSGHGLSGVGSLAASGMLAAGAMLVGGYTAAAVHSALL